MSRRAPNPAAERAAQNTQTIKSLLKLEGNKSCADCKRNKHPRWASWNLGIFVCIRCSGIHRGMGTHISRVKSVDLDSWTDEQLQSVLVWGNARANKYWEAKLAPGHVPSEAKIENFIRTKYESKRWVMEGPIPDPSTLDAEGDDDIPLNLVKEKHNIDRSASQKSSGPSATGPSSVRRIPQPDLFADDFQSQPRASTVSPTASRPLPKVEAAPPKQTRPADSLLGLDFFGTDAPPPNRPSSAAPLSGVTGQSRPDLKQSILSLYASAPRPQPQQQSQHSQHGSFGGMQSPQSPQSSTFGGMNDAFGGLSFTNPTPPAIQAQSAKSSAFAGLGNLSGTRSPPAHVKSPSGNFGGGSFFDIKPAQKPAAQPPAPSRAFSSSSGFGSFDSAAPIVPTVQSHPVASSGLGDLFDFGPSPKVTPAASKQAVSSPPPHSSVFNLSTPHSPLPQIKPQASVSNTSGWNNTDAWGSNDAWGATRKSSATTVNPITSTQLPSNSLGWGSGGSLSSQSIVPGGSGGFSSAGAGPPKVSADEDFGGWSSAAPVTPGAGTTSGVKPPGGFAASEDLFSNVWE